MSKNDSISMSVIRRLPRYYRFLSELNDQNTGLDGNTDSLNQDIQKISSRELSEKMRLTASQIRRISTASADSVSRVTVTA